jgi:hypothetical protein
MKSGKIIAGVLAGTVVALIIIPKTRKMISDAVNHITDAINDLADNTKNAAAKGKREVDMFADKAKDVANAAR